MGTRSLTRIHEGERKYINLYRQFDGYPSGHGVDLFAFLDEKVIVNGISHNTPKKAANGVGCLAAQLVSRFKSEIGGIYVYPVDFTDCGQDYEYIVNVEGELDGPRNITVQVIGYHGIEFTGTVAEFGAWCSKPDGDDEE